MLKILVGPIASGKSTYCQHEARNGAIIVNDDAIVTSVHGGIYKLYDKCLKQYYKSLELHAIVAGIMTGRDVVVDRTNLTKDTRQRYIQIGKAMGVETCAVVFPWAEPETHAQRRFNADARGYTYEYWLDVVRYHLSIYEPITETEGLNYVFNAG